MKKQIMSIAAVAAIFTTGAIAFDTDHNGRLLKQEGTTYIQGNYTWNAALNVQAALASPLTKGAPGALGDALIYPAFYSDNGWESEFTVINTGDEAMVAKVVLYSADNSKELKDFNIYLSAHDVFRATIKNNELIINDSSFVFQSSIPATVPDFGYTYTDTATDASKTPITESIPEGSGYIAVYGMVQADDATSDTYTIPGTTKDITSYHQNHDKLWRDYRHLVDECRGATWRGGINEGIYDTAALITPNILVNPSGATTCDHITSTLSKDDTAVNHETVTFKSPEAQLTGSITLKANDSRGTRAMKLNAVPLLNYTDDTVNQGMLWTEGEFASIADRHIKLAVLADNAFTAVGDIKASNVIYDGSRIQTDAAVFNSTVPYTYEYGNNEATSFVLTQPHKRTLIQLIQDKTTGAVDASCAGDSSVTSASLSWVEVTRSNNYISGTGGNQCLVTNYGSFIVNAVLYDDNENEKTADAGGFTFSPATATAASNKAPGEVSVISNIISDSDRADGFTSGYVNMTTNGVPGIATSMQATTVDGSTETNWIYSGKQQ